MMTPTAVPPPAEGEPPDPAPPAFLQAPRLHTDDEGGERHATWLELFFDLVFVVAVAQVAHLLEEDLSLTGFVTFVALFVPVWWQWIDFSYYADQFDTDDRASQVVTLVVMFGVLVMALAIPEVTHGGSAAFALAYAALRAILVALYAWAWRSVPQSRELAGRYTLSFAIALAVWLVSVLVPEPARFVLWAIALAIEIGNGPVTYATIRQVPRQISHMDERFGLFVIIVLGEAVLAVATGIAGTAWTWPVVLTASAGFAIAACFWWLYFVRADPSVINQALRSDRQGLLRSYLYGYSHFWLFAGATAAGVGIEAAIHAAPEGALPAGARLALGAGAALFLAGLAVVQWATPQSLPRPIARALGLGAAFCLGLALVGSGLPPLALTGLVLAVLAALIAFEARQNGRSLAEQAAEQPPQSETSVEAPTA